MASQVASPPSRPNEAYEILSQFPIGIHQIVLEYAMNPSSMEAFYLRDKTKTVASKLAVYRIVFEFNVRLLTLHTPDTAFHVFTGVTILKNSPLDEAIESCGFDKTSLDKTRTNFQRMIQSISNISIKWGISTNPDDPTDLIQRYCESLSITLT